MCFSLGMSFGPAIVTTLDLPDALLMCPVLLSHVALTQDIASDKKNKGSAL